MSRFGWVPSALVAVALVVAVPALRAQGVVLTTGGSSGPSQSVMAGDGGRNQGPINPTDLTRLDTTADDIAGRAAAIRTSDPTLYDEVTKRLADLRDDVTYLKVKLRKEGSVSRQEYADVSDRLQTLSNRVMSNRVTAQPVINGDPMGRLVSIGVGTQFDVRLQTPLNSGVSLSEQRFEATSIVDYKVHDDVVVPAGSTFRGFVSSVKAAGKIDRQGSMTLSFDEAIVSGTHMRVRASVVQALDAKTSQDNTRIGVGAAVGAILGGILGGGKGALVGVLVGGGGTMASTEGSDVDLPVGTVLRIRLDQPIDVTIGGLS